MQKLMSLKDVIDYTGISRSGIYYNIDKGLFPRPIKLGSKKIAWTEQDIEGWVNEKIKQREESKHVND